VQKGTGRLRFLSIASVLHPKTLNPHRIRACEKADVSFAVQTRGAVKRDGVRAMDDKVLFIILL